jgi:hypothetical protein
MTHPARPDRPYQFTLRRLLVTIFILAVFMTITADVVRRSRRVEPLFAVAGKSSASELLAAHRERQWLMDEMTVLFGGVVLWLLWELGFSPSPWGQNVPRLDRQRTPRAGYWTFHAVLAKKSLHPFLSPGCRRLAGNCRPLGHSGHN